MSLSVLDFPLPVPVLREPFLLKAQMRKEWGFLLEGEVCPVWVSEFGASELGMSEFGVSEVGCPSVVSEFGVSEFGVSEFGLPPHTQPRPREI